MIIYGNKNYSNMSVPTVNAIIRGGCPTPPQTYKTVVLKPCWVNNRNILLQEMMNDASTKYVIKWDFDLDGKTITVPENCVLEFDGGSLKNGTIIGQDTFINNVGGVADIFGLGIDKQGTWREVGDGSVKPGDLANYYTKSELDTGEGKRPTTGEVEEMIEQGGVKPEDVVPIVEDNAISYKKAQTLNDNQKQVARLNVGAAEDAEIKRSISNWANEFDERLDNTCTTGDVSQMISEAVPTKTTDLVNDAGFLTQHQDISGKADKSDTYTKEEVATMLSNILSNVPESDVIVVSELPVSGQANKLYRVAGEDSYSEYGWNGAVFVKLAEYNHGIDDEPDSESTNLISSKGVAETYGEYKTDVEFIQATTDANDRVINGIKGDGTNYFEKAESKDLKADEIAFQKSNNGVHTTEVVDDDTWNLIWTDDSNKIVGGLTKDGEWYFPKIKKIEEKAHAPFPDIVYRGGVFMPRAEWATLDGYTYRLQSGCMAKGWFILAGNRLHVEGVPDETYGVICVTKSITTFKWLVGEEYEEAHYFYGEYGHCNDITYNPNTKKVYVTCSHEDGPAELKGKVVEFDFDDVNGVLTFRRYVDIPDFSDYKGGVIHNIEYNYDDNTYIIGDYYTASIYDAGFNLVKKNVFYYPENVADAILGVPSSRTIAQGTFYYDGYVYKPLALKLDDVRYNMGILLRFLMDGTVDGIQIFRGPNDYRYEFEDIFVDTVHRKVYTLWDGNLVGFMEGYLDCKTQLLPRFLDNYEDMNHIVALGFYNIRNSDIASTIVNYPRELITPTGEETPEYHGASIEVKPLGVGGIVQYLTTFIGSYEENTAQLIRAMRYWVEGYWGEWIKID